MGRSPPLVLPADIGNGSAMLLCLPKHSKWVSKSPGTITTSAEHTLRRTFENSRYKLTLDADVFTCTMKTHRRSSWLLLAQKELCKRSAHKRQVSEIQFNSVYTAPAPELIPMPRWPKAPDTRLHSNERARREKELLSGLWRTAAEVWPCRRIQGTEYPPIPEVSTVLTWPEFWVTWIIVLIDLNT